MGVLSMSRAKLLLDYLTSVRAEFAGIAPGQLDCALFAARWAEVCGVNTLCDQWAGKYQTLQEGRALLTRAGFADLGQLAAEHLTHVQGGWRNAEVGDIAVLREHGEVCLGIIGGVQIHVLGQKHLHAVSLHRAQEVLRP